MFLVSSCSCLCPIHWSQVLSWEWRCSWSSADRRCSNYIWVINNFIAYWGVTYIRDFMVCVYVQLTVLINASWVNLIKWLNNLYSVKTFVSINVSGVDKIKVWKGHASSTVTTCKYKLENIVAIKIFFTIKFVTNWCLLFISCEIYFESMGKLWPHIFSSSLKYL